MRTCLKLHRSQYQGYDDTVFSVSLSTIDNDLKGRWRNKYGEVTDLVTVDFRPGSFKPDWQMWSIWAANCYARVKDPTLERSASMPSLCLLLTESYGVYVRLYTINMSKNHGMNFCLHEFQWRILAHADLQLGSKPWRWCNYWKKQMAGEIHACLDSVFRPKAKLHSWQSCSMLRCLPKNVSVSYMLCQGASQQVSQVLA